MSMIQPIGISLMHINLTRLEYSETGQLECRDPRSSSLGNARGIMLEAANPLPEALAEGGRWFPLSSYLPYPPSEIRAPEMISTCYRRGYCRLCSSLPPMRPSDHFLPLLPEVAKGEEGKHNCPTPSVQINMQLCVMCRFTFDQVSNEFYLYL